MRRTPLATLLIVPIFALVLLGCPADEPRDVQPPPEEPPPAEPMPDVELPEGVTQDMVTQGRQLFAGRGNCFACHGMDGSGTPAGPDLTDDTWINLPTGSYAEIVENVRTGVPQPVQYPAPMPPMGGARLTEDEMRAIGAYVYVISRS